MTIAEKLKILADSAKYDASCASSGSKRKNVGGIGDGNAAGICHSWSADGRCISLLKILFSNNCIYDCVYCLNRRSNDILRAEFTPQEVADLTIEFYKRNYIEGLFLSSAVIKNPDYTMELIIKTLELLRNQHKFFGYIHVKIIPGASDILIKKAGLLADRVSVNIELPSETSLKRLAPQKSRKSVISPMKQISCEASNSIVERKHFKNAPTFAPAGQSTQMIIGASGETDLQIISLTQGLYDKFKLKRIYFSAYIPVVSDPKLPSLDTSPPLLREHRLYQADWLLRYYGFKADEILDEYNPYLSVNFDPKCAWALKNPQFFPVDVNKADYAMILRVPGIGVISAKRIISARRHSKLTVQNLKAMGVVLKRAKYFIVTADNRKDASALQFSPAAVGFKLTECDTAYRQLSLFDDAKENDNVLLIR